MFNFLVTFAKGSCLSSMSLVSFLWAESSGVSSSENMDSNTHQEWNNNIEETQDLGQSSHAFPGLPTCLCSPKGQKKKLLFFEPLYFCVTLFQQLIPSTILWTGLIWIAKHLSFWVIYLFKAERRRIDAFELWWWRRFLRVPWTARRSNQSILKEIIPEYLV